MSYSCPLKLSTPLVKVDSYRYSYDKKQFARSLRISPDGFKVLSILEDRSLTLSHLGVETYNRFSYYSLGEIDDGTTSQPLSSIEPYSKSQLGESIYDVQWVPLNQNPSNEDLVLISMREHPIHLYDLHSNTVRSAYVGRDHLDELESSLCVAFNNTGDKFYAGADRTIRCFDINVPGSECTSFYTAKTRKSMFGQKGLISCLQFNPDGSGCYAAGSFLGSVSIYVENSTTSVLDITGFDRGVSHMRWSPCGNYLWVGTRHHPEISCWDIRGTKNKLHTISRSCTTNQRMIFDLDPWGQYLATGDQTGDIHFYDTATCTLQQSISTNQGRNMNTCLFHPFCSLLLTASGERVFDQFEDSDSGSDSDSSLSPKKRQKRESVSSQQQQSEKGSYLTMWSMDFEKLSLDATNATEAATAEATTGELIEN